MWWGKIVDIEKHPDADKLLVTQIDNGEEEFIQIVTARKNFRRRYVPVNLHGGKLPRQGHKKGLLRGVESNGMLCSLEELALRTR